MSTTAARKKDHLKIAGEDLVSYQSLKTGFEKFRFIHNALPEINLDEVSLTTTFLDHQLEVPLMITAMTGGDSESRSLNKDLAAAAQASRVALGLGSLRTVLENPDTIDSFTIARKHAPDIPIVANIGAVQVLNLHRTHDFYRLIKEIDANALAIHLNPLQEALQPEGQPSFKGVCMAIEILKDTIPVPVIVREVGFGLSADVIKRLKKIGVEWIDIAGAGGTSWARIEEKRIKDPFASRVARHFFEWGIPTATALQEAVKYKSLKIIASGGITDGVQFSKAIAMGAELGGAAHIFLKAWRESGEQGILEIIRLFRETLRLSMFATGCRRLNDFRGNSAIITRVDEE